MDRSAPVDAYALAVDVVEVAGRVGDIAEAEVAACSEEAGDLAYRIRTEAPKLNADGLGLTVLEKTVTLGLPCPTVESPLLITPGFVGTLTDIPTGADIPGELFEGYIQARWLKKLNDRLGIELAVVKDQWDVEFKGNRAGILRMGRETHARGSGDRFVPRVDLVIHEVKTKEPRVDVLCREIQPVIVVPERAQGLPVIPSDAKFRGSEPLIHSRVEVGKVVVPVATGVIEIKRTAIALGSDVGVVDVGARRRHPEAERTDPVQASRVRQPVVDPQQVGTTVAAPDHRPGHDVRRRGTLRTSP